MKFLKSNPFSLAFSRLKKFRRKVRKIRLRFIGRLLGRLSHAWYWVTSHTLHRYHIINLRGEAGYKWGWIDADHAMLLACFKLLRDFVEIEDPKVGLRKLSDFGIMSGQDYDFVERQLETELEIRRLYDWWTKRAVDWGSFEWNSLEHWEEQQQMLVRLIKIRGSLWT